MSTELEQKNFSSTQKQYLAGFFAGAGQREAISFLGKNEQGQFTNDPAEAVEETVWGTSIDDLCKEEQIKFEQNGLDVWDSMVANAEMDEFPVGGDVFRYKFYGLFHVKPAQDSFMLRARIAGSQMMSHQMRGMAEVARDWGGGYLDVTTRGNLQIREIMPQNTIKVLTKVTDIGLTSKGAGADNIRNVTATSTSGFDPEEIYDVLPLAKSMHHHILNNRDLYGLPRKFNISFDSGGRITVCADTNDIGFYAVRVGEGHGVEPGVYFRVQLCGITGHKQFASDCGLLLKPEDCVTVAAAMVRVFIEHGDRTNRKKARLKYLVDDWGVRKFLEMTQTKLAKKLVYLDLEKCEARKPVLQHGHVGIYNQKQEGLFYVGVVIPVGRILPEQMEQLADLADKYGKGEVRLTVWQNMIIPHVKESDLEELKQALIDIGFHYTTHSVTGGLIACTGNRGCKYAASNTKGHAVELGEFLKTKFDLDQPINIHLTGCHHSCAQHYIGDIGMMGVKAKYNGETVEGYNIAFGGGVDDNQAIARDVFKAVPFQEIPALIEHCLNIYLEKRESHETFAQFTRRFAEAELVQLFAPSAA